MPQETAADKAQTSINDICLKGSSRGLHFSFVSEYDLDTLFPHLLKNCSILFSNTDGRIGTMEEFFEMAKHKKAIADRTKDPVAYVSTYLEAVLYFVISAKGPCHKEGHADPTPPQK